MPPAECSRARWVKETTWKIAPIGAILQLCHFALTTGKHTHITKENNKGMEDLSASNISHVSLKPSKCIHITTLFASTFQNHDNAYGIFSDRTQLSSSLFNRGSSIMCQRI